MTANRLFLLVALAGINDGRLLAVLDSTAGGTGGLDALDDLEGLIVGNLAEDDVAAIQPGGHDGGDEELRAVAGMDMLVYVYSMRCSQLGPSWMGHTCWGRRWPWTADQGGCA